MSINPKEEAILKLIAEDSTYENYFFKKVSDLKWFYLLKERDYFNPNKNIGPQPSDKEGYVVIPQWNVLEYLEKVSLQVGNPENEKYIVELLDIMKSVDNSKEPAGNYRTSWYFIKILLNIPNNKIPLEIMKLIPSWLSSRYGSSLVDADLARKLLPKFFNKDASAEDLEKGELIIDYLTEIKWINKKGMFKDIEESPVGVAENHWLEEAFFEKGIAKLIGDIGSEKIIYKLANKLKAIFRKHHKTNWIDFEEGDKTYRFSIDHEDDYLFVCKISFYEKKGKEGEGALLESMKVVSEVLFEFKINAQNLNDFVEKVGASMEAIKVSEGLKQEIDTKLKDLYKNVLEDYSYIWLKDLLSQSSLHEIQHILLAIVAIALVQKAKVNTNQTREIIAKFLSSEFPNPAFMRLVLLVISKEWSSFKDIFWDKLFNLNEEPIFETSDFERELEMLLRENITNFITEEKTQLDNLITKGPQKYLPEKNPEGYILYWKKNWYKYLKEDQFFASKYEEIKAISKFDDKKENGEGDWIGIPESPFSSEQMIKTPNAEIAAFLLEFKTKDKWEERTSEAVANALEEAVKNKPAKFAEDLNPFMDTGFYYVYHLLSGFKKAWKNKTSFDLSKVISFIEKYIDREVFWNNKLIVPAGFYNADNKWITGIIGELIQEGSHNDDWSIPTDSFPSIKRINSLIGENAAKDEKEANNFPAHVINCGLGKTLIGLVYFILLVARVEKKESEPRWSSDLKEIYESYLNRNIYDAYAVLGEYLISFGYLDKEWTKKQITKIKKSDDKVLWDAFMSGYLSASRVNLDIYQLMKDFYLKGISHEFKESQLNQRLIDHIGIAYLNGIEELEGDSLLGVLWKSQNHTQMLELIFYFWTQRENLKYSELDVQMKSRIIDFWRQIYKKYKDKENLTKNDKEILSDMIKLIVYLPEINEENFQWLLLSGPYAEEHYNSAFLMEYLNILKDKGDKEVTANRIATIFLKILDIFKPYYDQEDILSIVEYLYALNNLEISSLANKICHEYAKAGEEIVTEIYKKYNP